eukprot:Skav207750  [mRNA]  locus=scaffold181:71271:72819:- [translate_table: standard]
MDSELGIADEKDSAFHVVVCSPYSRCVQTAVKICKRLGPNVKMLIDLSLGEVYGPSVMGEARRSEETLYLLKCHEAT